VNTLGVQDELNGVVSVRWQILVGSLLPPVMYLNASANNGPLQLRLNTTSLYRQLHSDELQRNLDHRHSKQIEKHARQSLPIARQ